VNNQKLGIKHPEMT